MRVAVVLFSVVSFVAISNVTVGLYGSAKSVALLSLLSYFLTAVTLAGILSVCQMRSTWIAFAVTCGLFTIMAVLESQVLQASMSVVVEGVQRYCLLPPEDAARDYYPQVRLRDALVTSCPLVLGVGAATVALVFFPGNRLRHQSPQHYSLFKELVS